MNSDEKGETGSGDMVWMQTSYGKDLVLSQRTQNALITWFTNMRRSEFLLTDKHI